MDIYKLMKILSNKNYIRIITHLYYCECHSFNATNLYTKLNINQTLFSKNIKFLQENGVVDFEKKHKFKYFKLRNKFKNEWKNTLKEVVNHKQLKEFKCHCNH